MSPPLLETRDLSVIFDVAAQGGWPWSPARQLQAVKQASLVIEPGQTLGLVGESGSGKSTLARAIVGTVPTAAGKVLWRGDDISAMDPAGRRAFGRHVQMVFQDPLAALNPRMTVGQIIAEPLLTHFPDLRRRDVQTKVGAMMERVGLLPTLVNRYPHEFSGGQCQRVGIARALITEPDLVVCDEPVSALDVSVQAQVVNLLQDLQRDLGLALLFIAHDLSVVRHISHRIAVMYLGRIMESAEAAELIANPRHPYTRALIASVPIPSPRAERARARPVLDGELPSPLAPPSGCVFRTRCPVAQQSCAGTTPELADIGADHLVACPHHASQNRLNPVN